MTQAFRVAQAGALLLGTVNGQALLWDAVRREWKAGTVATGVLSFNGRVGAVVPLTNDYDSDQVANLSNVPGAEVSDALDLLYMALSTLNSSQVANVSGVAGAKVTNALDTLAAAIAAVPGLTIVTEAGATRTLTSADRNCWIRFTAAGGCVVTVNNGVFAAGDVVFLRQAAAGAVSFAGTAALTPPTTNVAISGQQGATMALTFTTANAADVSGDLQDA